MRATQALLILVFLFLGAFQNAQACCSPGEALAVQTAREFFVAFQERDHPKMGGLYADKAKFSDAIYPDLDAAHVRVMWRRLLSDVRVFNLKFSKITPKDDTTVEVHWEAKYVYPATRREVTNKVVSTLKIEIGKIVDHRDDFRLCAGEADGRCKNDDEKLCQWSQMAFPKDAAAGLCQAPAILRSQAAAQLEDDLKKDREMLDPRPVQSLSSGEKPSSDRIPIGARRPSAPPASSRGIPRTSSGMY